MKPFLKQVADHYYCKYGDYHRLCLIFPNRRSMVFFRKYLAEVVAADPESRPIVVPQMFTINDFFSMAGKLHVADRVRLLVELYECYRRLNPKAESLDEFIFWGDVLLGDFNDVDKYLVDPEQLFTNVSDYKSLQDNFSYLTETQRKAIEGFVSHFNDRSGRLTVDIGSDDVKSRFLQVWNILYPLYKDFNVSLDMKGWAYEGKVYRKLAEMMSSKETDVFPDIMNGAERYVFVGLNALNECEKRVLGRLRDAGVAEFCWDWSGKMIRDPKNRSSFFMADNVRDFPQAFEPDPDGLEIPEINVISVASSVGQAKRLPDILREVKDPQSCAVVLPDENLLIPVLNSIPESVRDINVTMGLPMKGSQIYVMMSDISALQLHSVYRKGECLFYHKHVWDIFSGEVFRKVADEDTVRIMERIRKEARYYISRRDLSGTPLLDLVFEPVIADPKVASRDQIMSFSEYQKRLVSTLACRLSDDRTFALELEYAKEYYRCVNVLQEIDIDVLPVTYVRLLSQILGNVSVPFRGEPLKGMQIMGPLETRALDFTDIIVLSADEGVFPRRSVSSSFIPPELRKGFGLPTYEYQDAVWAYYFYRMISRAENVWMLTDSRTEGLKSGEESRYIKQLEYHFGLPIHKYTVRFAGMKSAGLPRIDKTEDDVARIKDTVLSATVIQNYLACPAKFYYGTVRNLKPEEEVAESLDYGMFGTVYHEVMRAVYSGEYAMREDFVFDDGALYGGLPEEPMKKVSRSYIRSWLHRGEDIRRKVKSLIMSVLNVIEVSGRNLVIADVIVRYVLKTLERDLEQLEQAGAEEFDILGRELKVTGEFHGQRFKGYVDRLDSFRPGQARIVDYKTGKVLDDDENIHDGNAEDIASRIFEPDVKDRPKIALQFYIYDLLLSSRPEVQGREIYNCVYSTSRIFTDSPVTVPVNRKFYDAVSGKMKDLLDEMYDISVPFRRTDDRNICRYCDFNKICLR